MPDLYRACYRMDHTPPDQAYASEPQPLQDAVAQTLQWVRKARVNPLVEAVLGPRIEAGERVRLTGVFGTWEQWVEEAS